MPRFLDLLAEEHVRGTFFTTGEMARRFPDTVARIVRDGHELGCHGDLHQDFTTLDRAAAEKELSDSLATLRAFAPVVSFRAPFLRFPAAYRPLLVEHGIHVDSSTARYKFGPHHDLRGRGVNWVGSSPRAWERSRPSPSENTAEPDQLIRIPASVTSSVLRLPPAIRCPWMAALKPPVVLFIHPWEAVDFRHSRLRWDCRFQTGESAIRHWRAVIAHLRQRGGRFLPLNEIALMPA